MILLLIILLVVHLASAYQPLTITIHNTLFDNDQPRTSSLDLTLASTLPWILSIFNQPLLLVQLRLAHSSVIFDST